MVRRETLVSGERREYMSKNRTTLTSMVKATLKKVGKVTMETFDPSSVEYYYHI